jgi:hypothetical protein
MADAEGVARRLAYEFLREGRYSSAHGPVEVKRLAQAAAAATAGEEIVDTQEAFGNIAVQSVGFEEGVDDPKVHIYLTQGSARQIRSLTSTIDGVPVRAHKMGTIAVRPEMAATSTNHGHLFEHAGRISCGSSCAPTSENCSGTFGSIVKLAGSNDLYVLSNNHVLAGCNHVPQGQPILSPSSNDGRPTIRAPGEIARHERIHELRSGNPNFVNPCDADIALARVSHAANISSWQGDDAQGYDTPIVVSAPTSRMSVKKFGRTTGMTTGLVEARVDTPMPVEYNSKHFKGVVWFQNVWTVRGANGPFALPGDSGSLVVSNDGQLSVGLVFAASRNGEYAWIIPMPCVVNSFGGLELVGGHGV